MPFALTQRMKTTAHTGNTSTSMTAVAILEIEIEELEEIMAPNLTAMGKREEAAQLYTRALAICEKTLEPTHPRAAGCRRNLERCQRSIGISQDT